MHCKADELLAQYAIGYRSHSARTCETQSQQVTFQISGPSPSHPVYAWIC